MTARHRLVPVFVLFAALLACGPEAALAGTIKGTIRAESAVESAPGESGGNYGSRRYKFLERVDYDELTDFVVYIDQAMPAESDAPPARAQIVQRNGAFVPHVLPVMKGTVVEFPNEDDIFHNVFSMTESTPFDLGLYKRGDTARQIKFEQTGRVDLFCSIHTRMNCVVLVVPNRWFTVPDARGRWRLAGLPAGTYRVRGWHERLPGKIVEVTVSEDREAEADLVLGLAALSKQ